MEEIDYYRTQSGLAAGLSQQDYEYEYFKTASGLSAGLSIDDYKTGYYAAQTGFKDQVTAEYAYFLTNSGGTRSMSLEDLKKKFLWVTGAEDSKNREKEYDKELDELTKIAASTEKVTKPVVSKSKVPVVTKVDDEDDDAAFFASIIEN